MFRYHRSLAIVLVGILLVSCVPASGYAVATVETASGSDDLSDAIETDLGDAGDDVDNTTDDAGDDVDNTTNQITADVDDTTDDAEQKADDTTNHPADAPDDGEDTTNNAGTGVEDTIDEAEERSDRTVHDGDDTTAALESDSDDVSVRSELTTGTIAIKSGMIDGITETAGVFAHAKMRTVLAIEQSVTLQLSSADGSITVSTTTGGDDSETGTTGADDSQSKTAKPTNTKIENRSASVASSRAAELSASDDATQRRSDSQADRVDNGSVNNAAIDNERPTAGTTNEGRIPISAEKTGSGIAIGALLGGIALVARTTGTAAGLSTLSGSGGSLVGTLVSLIRNWIGRLLTIFGYQRYSADDPLEHETRAQLYECICDSPGTYLSEIKDETNLTMGTARYHLRILEFENLIVSEQIRGRRRYVPVGTAWAELEAALQDDSTAQILEALVNHGPDSVSGLAEHLDRDPSTITHHLDRLASDGIVERERDGRAVLNKLAEEAQIVLEEEPTATASKPVPGSAD